MLLPALAKAKTKAQGIHCLNNEHQIALATDQEQPLYPMNYADEAARSLGVRGGRWEAFDTGPTSSSPFMPSLRGGVDSGGAMIRLQWR